jgi:hypothetical protein
MSKRRRKKRKNIDTGKFGWEAKYLTRPVYMATATLVVCLFAGAGLLDRYITEGGSPYMAAVISAVLVDLANDDRAAADVQGLRVNPKLVAAAQLKANDMAAKSYFAHQTPEGYDSWHWFEVVGYDYTHAGENLAVDFSESSDVENAWMQSPTHRDNILNENYTEIGIATAKGIYEGRETVFAVQMFGRPSAMETARAVGAPLAASEASGGGRGDAGGSLTASSQIESHQVAGETTEPTHIEVTPLYDEAQSGALADEDGDAMVIAPEDIPWWARLAVQPKQTLRYAYLIIGLFILTALFLDMEWEIHKHHLRHAKNVGAILATMSMLFIVADWIFFAEPILAAVGKLIGS